MRIIIKALALLGLVLLALPFVVAVIVCPPGARGAKAYRVEEDFKRMHKSLEAYVINAGQPPTAVQGLDVLVVEPTAEHKPRRWSRLMEKLPDDPWGTPYRYTSLLRKEREWRWELRSAGPDQLFGSGDDMSSEDGAARIAIPDAAGAGERVDPLPSF